MLLTSLKSLFFPDLCLSCGEVLLNSKDLLCLGCCTSLAFTHHYEQVHNDTYNRFYGRLAVQKAASLLFYHKNGKVQKLIHKLKYGGQTRIGEYLAEESYNQYNGNVFLGIDCIVPMPLHPLRIKERGYNQVDSFADRLGDLLDVPVDRTVVKRVKYSESQTHKSLEERQQVLTDTFVLDIPKENCHFLLVDDVVTTGSSLTSCGQVILQQHQSRLSIFTMAFAYM